MTEPKLEESILKGIRSRIQEIAVDEGMRIADKFFAKRKNPSEAHVSRGEFAGMLAIAYAQGVEHGLTSTIKGLVVSAKESVDR